MKSENNRNFNVRKIDNIIHRKNIILNNHNNHTKSYRLNYINYINYPNKKYRPPVKIDNKCRKSKKKRKPTAHAMPSFLSFSSNYAWAGN